LLWQIPQNFPFAALFCLQADTLKFFKLDLGHRRYGLRPVLLPTFFYAGQIRIAVDSGA
jgi:hypothetical protein